MLPARIDRGSVRAVAAAPRGARIVVCAGVYAEDVVVKKPLHLVGRHAVIDATGLENAIQVVRSRVTVRGFVVENANGEGILVGIDSPQDAHLLPKSIVISHVTISDVVAAVNDKGFNHYGHRGLLRPGRAHDDQRQRHPARRDRHLAEQDRKGDRPADEPLPPGRQAHRARLSDGAVRTGGRCPAA